MGILRLLLAITVFCFHSGLSSSLGMTIIDGRAAVFCFFAVSGFYMEMVLSEKYNRERLGSSYLKMFYSARFWRLYPTYILIVLATTLISVAYPHIELPKVLDMSHNVGLLANVRSIVTWFFNISMLFLNIPSVFDLVIGPSWSVGIEISFYAVAPFLLRLKAWPLIMLSIFGILLQLIPYGQHSPILFGFHFFLLGAFARRYTFKIESWVSHIGNPPLLLLYATVFVILFFAIPGNIYFGPSINHAHNTVSDFIYPVIIAGLIPLLHERTYNLKIDSWIGQLSYPFYLLHALIIECFTGWLYIYKVPLLLLLCLSLSIIIVLFEMRFIEPWRSRFAYKRI